MLECSQLGFRGSRDTLKCWPILTKLKFIAEIKEVKRRQTDGRVYF